MIENEVFDGRLRDGGPIYHETNLDHFISEPWNAFSSLTFIIPVIIFMFLLKGQYKNYKFIIYWCSPLLVIGGIGSTLYHAFRVSKFFLLMDVLPIVILTISVSIYFMVKILPNWKWVVGVILVSIILRFLIFGTFELKEQTAINISYFITGILIFVPALFLIRQTKMEAIKDLLLSTFFLSLALFFRYYDDVEKPFIAMGTHWLWHVACAIGALYLGLYLKKIKDFYDLKLKPVNN